MQSGYSAQSIDVVAYVQNPHDAPLQCNVQSQHDDPLQCNVQNQHVDSCQWNVQSQHVIPSAVPRDARWRHPISCMVTRYRHYGQSINQSIKLSPCDVNPEVEVVLKTGQCRDRMLCVVLTHINGMCRVGVMTQYVRW